MLGHNSLKRRFLIKLSGEVFKGSLSGGISFETIDFYCKRLSKIIKNGVDIGFVVGGGNIFRGVQSNLNGYNRLIGDNIGMIATIINGLSISERLNYYGIQTKVQSGIKIEGITSLFNRDEVEMVFKNNGAVIFCGGIGNPYFSTDTTAALRGLQIGADCVFKATKVDGIYDKDPVKFKDAKKYQYLTYDQIIKDNIEVMDLTSILLLKQNKMPLMVFNMMDDSSLEKACNGEIVGTLVKE